jgi:DNA-binding GntR family transcriptional regulator
LINSSLLPAYTRITNAITLSIENGEYAAGDQLPSQRELCKKYHTSLMTIRRVLDELHREGLIRSIPGKGIFVRQIAKPNEYGSLIGFETQMARLGLKPFSKTLEARIIPATTFLAQMLKIQPGSSVVYVYRLRYADGIPMSLYKVYLPHDLCPGILEKGLSEGSLYSILQSEYHMHLVGSRNTASAVLPDADAKKYFELSESIALLLREQITYLDTGEIIEYSRNITPGDSFCVQYDEGRVF